MVRNLTEGTAWKQIVALAIPLLLGNIFQASYNLVDTMIVGRFVGPEALAGVGVASPVFNLINALLIGLSVGSSIVVSQLFGAGRERDLPTAVNTVVWTSLGLAVILTAVGQLLVDPFLTVLKTPAEDYFYAEVYLRTILCGLVCNVFYNQLSGLLRGLGNTKVPLYFLNKLAKDNGYKALLSGEGADELFAGYTAYGFNTKVKFIRWVTEQLKKLPKDQRYKLGKWLEGKHFHGSEHLYRNLAPARDTFIGQAYIFSPAEANEYLKPEYQDGPSITDLLKPLYDKCDEKKPEMNEVAKKQYVDLHRFMPGDICLKADKMSMANSVEIRVPLLDKEVMKVAETTPTKYLFNDKGTKWAFRMAANRHLPEEWATRPKLGFPTPVREWLREEKYYKEVRNLFAQDFVKEFFDQDKLLQLADDNFAGKVDGRRKIWTVYTFLVWYKLYFIDNFKLDESNIDKAKVSAEA